MPGALKRNVLHQLACDVYNSCISHLLDNTVLKDRRFSVEGEDNWVIILIGEYRVVTDLVSDYSFAHK